MNALGLLLPGYTGYLWSVHRATVVVGPVQDAEERKSRQAVGFCAGERTPFTGTGGGGSAQAV